MEEKTLNKEEEKQTQKPIVHNTEKQIETRAASGKKRIQPIFLSEIKPINTSELFTTEASDILPANPARAITEIERLKALQKKKRTQNNETEEFSKEKEIIKVKQERMEEDNQNDNNVCNSSGSNSSDSDSDNEVFRIILPPSSQSPARKRKRELPEPSSKSPSTNPSKNRKTIPNRIKPSSTNTHLDKNDDNDENNNNNNEDEISQTQNDNVSDDKSGSNALVVSESETRKPKRRRKPKPSHNEELVEAHESEPQRPSYLLMPIQPSALLTCTIFNDNINSPTNILYTITAQTDLNNNTKTRLYKNNIEELSFIPNQAVCMVGNKYYLCICDNCNTLYILNSDNGIHLGSYILPAPLHLFALNSNSILFCLTMNGNCLLYDLSDFHLICESDIISVIQSMCDSIPLPNEITILRTFITNNGIPVITIKIANNLRCFAFNIKMKLWTPMDSCGYLLSEFYSTYSYSLSTSSSITTIVASSSSTSTNDYNNTNNNNNGNSSNYNISNNISSQQSTSSPLSEIQLPLREFQNNNNNNSNNGSNNLVRLLYNSSNSDIQRSTRIHIENQIGSSIVLNSKEDFKYWMIKYIDFLAKNSDEARITVLCNSFLGKSNSIYCYKSFDFNTKDFLLNEVLPILSTNISLQRLVSQFMDEYNSLESQNKVNLDTNGTYKPNYY